MLKCSWTFLINRRINVYLFGRSGSAGRLPDMLLKAVFGSQLDRGSRDGLNIERPMDTTGRYAFDKTMNANPSPYIREPQSVFILSVK